MVQFGVLANTKFTNKDRKCSGESTFGMKTFVSLDGRFRLPYYMKILVLLH